MEFSKMQMVCSMENMRKVRFTHSTENGYKKNVHKYWKFFQQLNHVASDVEKLRILFGNIIMLHWTWKIKNFFGNIIKC